MDRYTAQCSAVYVPVHRRRSEIDTRTRPALSVPLRTDPCRGLADDKFASTELCVAMRRGETPQCTNVVIPSNAHTTYPSTGTAICSQMGTCVPTRRLYGIDMSLERHMTMGSVCARRVGFSTMFSDFPNFDFSLTCDAQRREKRLARTLCISSLCGCGGIPSNQGRYHCVDQEGFARRRVSVQTRRRP